MTSLALSIASLVVSIVAVAISLSQALLAKRESSRSRPNVKVLGVFGDGFIRGGQPMRALLLYVFNTGREETELSNVNITSANVTLVGAYSLFAGPPLPCRIPGHSMQTWTFDASAVEDAATAVTVHAEFGHGENKTLLVTKGQF
ncbi:hypothetical protein [Streptomyces sp. NPDC054794]